MIYFCSLFFVLRIMHIMCIKRGEETQRSLVALFEKSRDKEFSHPFITGHNYSPSHGLLKLN